MRIYGAPDGVTIDTTNAGWFSGVIYAPDATVTVSDINTVMYGAVIAKTFEMTNGGSSGHPLLHFDEAVKDVTDLPSWMAGGGGGGGSAVTVTSWTRE